MILVRKLYQDLGVIARMAQRLKHLRNLFDANYVGHHRLRLDFAARQGSDLSSKSAGS